MHLWQVSQMCVLFPWVAWHFYQHWCSLINITTSPTCAITLLLAHPTFQFSEWPFFLYYGVQTHQGGQGAMASLKSVQGTHSDATKHLMNGENGCPLMCPSSARTFVWIGIITLCHSHCQLIQEWRQNGYGYWFKYFRWQRVRRGG